MLSSYKTVLTEKKLLTGNTYLLTFKLNDPVKMEFVAGQYVILKVPKEDGFISRLYSIASSSIIKTSFELLIELIPNGIGSNFINGLKIGNNVDFQGPAGIFKLKNNNRTVIFFVTGTGIAPTRSILKSNPAIKNFYIFWGLKKLKDCYLLDELKQFKIKICLSREESLDKIQEEDKKYFDQGHIDLCFNKQFNNLTSEQLNSFDFYLCGSRGVVDSLKQFLLSKNISPENIIFEKF